MFAGNVGGGNGAWVAVRCAAQEVRRTPKRPGKRKRKFFTGVAHLIPLTAYPAIAGVAAKDQLRGRREF